MAELQPPKQHAEDPGAHELEESSDDHFSSASEGDENRPHSSSSNPIMRVGRVDDQPAHGEVPGTDAYNKRLLDAVPDEMEVVPEGQRSRSNTTRSRSNTTRSRAASNLSTGSGTNSPIPRTVVERVDDRPAHGEVEGTAARELRLADAEPDEIKVVPQSEEKKATLNAAP